MKNQINYHDSSVQNLHDSRESIPDNTYDTVTISISYNTDAQKYTVTSPDLHQMRTMTSHLEGASSK